MRRAFVLLLAVFSSPAFAQGDDVVTRGKYLTVLGDCAACHTNKNGPQFAGGRGLDSGVGTIYSSNLTPDTETGIGNWTADQFYRAMHKGIAADDSHLYPAFPYPYFTHMTRADDDAIYAYLRTVPGIHEKPPPNKLPFPVNIRGVMAIWNALYFKEGEYKPDPVRSTQWNRGAYIVTGPGHCGGCHTPKNFLKADKNDQALGGGVTENWFAADLSGDAREGLGAWNAADIEEYLKTGRNVRSTASGSMQEVVEHSTGRMTEDDRGAIAAYLKSLPPAVPTPPMPDPDPAALKAGEAIFADACASCHLAQGEGQKRLFPPLAGNASVQSRDPTTILRLVLQGSRSPATKEMPTPLAMPAFDWKLSDGQIADVATYIRNSWGNHAAQVNASDVGQLRGGLAKEPKAD